MITIDATSSLKPDKVIEVVDSFCLLKSTMNSKGNKETCHKAELDRIALKILAKIFICYYVSIPAKIRILHFFAFLCGSPWQQNCHGLQRSRIEKLLVPLIVQY